MDIEVIRRICLARHLYELAVNGLKSANELYVFSASNLMQDAVEVFLIALADFVGASILPNSNFEGYFSSINKKIEPKELPFKNKLIRLNKIRVNSKHYGIQPDRVECERLSLSVREFFDEVSTSILGANFATISTMDLLDDGDTKTLLLQAKEQLDRREYADCSISCRKALFLELERRYDISGYNTDEPPKGLLGGVISDAPYFAKNKKYIEEHVSCPTDLIVFDHSHLDQRLLTLSINNAAFWNVWRLTPEVYRKKSGDWVVKHELDKLEVQTLENNIEYIFNTTADIILSVHTNKKNIKTKSYFSFKVDLVIDQIDVYEKADKDSKVIGKTPEGIFELKCSYHIEGLKEDGPYWKVTYAGKDKYLYGYILNEYVK